MNNTAKLRNDNGKDLKIDNKDAHLVARHMKKFINRYTLIN